MENLSMKLRSLKSRVKKWEKVEKERLLRELKHIKGEISKILKEIENGTQNPNCWTQLKDVEDEKRNILLFHEQTWCLKSRATWLKEGDNQKVFKKKL